MCITLCVSYLFAPGSCRVDINCKRKILSMTLRPSTTYQPCPGTLMPRLIITENECDNIAIRYNAVAHLYWSAKSSVFSYIVMNVLDIMLRSFNNLITFFLHAIVVEESCSMSSKKNEENTAWSVLTCAVPDVFFCPGTLKCSNTMPSIYTYIFLS